MMEDWSMMRPGKVHLLAQLKGTPLTEVIGTEGSSDVERPSSQRMPSYLETGESRGTPSPSWVIAYPPPSLKLPPPAEQQSWEPFYAIAPLLLLAVVFRKKLSTLITSQAKSLQQLPLAPAPGKNAGKAVKTKSKRKGKKAKEEAAPLRADDDYGMEGTLIPPWKEERVNGMERGGGWDALER